MPSMHNAPCSMVLHRASGQVMTSKNRLTVNLSDDEHLALEALAVRSKVSKAWIARYAICELLDRAARDELQLPLPLQRQRGGGKK